MSATPAAPDPERIAEAVLAHPAVAGLHRGPLGVVASYLPGRRIEGVRVTEDGRVELALAVRFGQRMPTVARQLRAAVRELAGDLPVDIAFVDVVEAQQNDSPVEDSP